MANGIELAKAYVQIVPSAEGIEGSLEEAMNGAGEKAGKAGGKGLASGLGGALGGVAKVAAAGVTAAAGAMTAFGASSVSAGREFDSAMSQVAATMGLTNDDVKDLRSFAQEMGASTAFSATEAAEALNYMALAGYDSKTAMAMLPTVLDLAAAGGMDLASASDMVTDTQSALNLSLEDTAAMVDQMAKASSKSNTSVSQLGDAMLTIGGTAQNLNGGTRELSTVLGVLADNGIKGSEAGTHLRNIMLSLTPTTEDAAAAMEQIGLQAYDAQGEMRPLNDVFLDLQKGLDGMSTQEKQNILGAIFNKTDLSSINALLGTTSDRWEELSQEINGAWYTSQGLSKAFDDVIGYNVDFEEFSHSFENIGISADNVKWALDESGGSAELFADLLWETADAGVDLEDILQAMPMDVDELQLAFDGAGGAAQTMANTQLDNLSGDITLFQSALEGAKIAVSDSLTPSLREFVGFGTDGITKLTEAFQSEGLTGAASVFGDLLGQGIQMIVDKLPEIVQMGSEIFKGLVDGILAALPVLIENLPTIIETFLGMIMDIMTAIVEALPTIIQGICDALPIIIPQIITAIVDLFLMLVEHLDEILTPLTEAMPTIINSLIDALIENLPRIIAGIIMLVVQIIAQLPGIIKGIWETITHFFTKVWQEWIGPVFEKVIGWFGKVWEGIKGVFAAVGQWFAGIFKSAWTGIKNAFAAVGTFFSNVWGKIKGAFAAVGQWFAGIFQNAWTGIKNAFSAVGTFFSNIWGKIKRVFSTVKTWFANIFSKAWEAIKKPFQKAGEWFQEIFDKIKDVIKAPINFVIRGLNTLIGGLNKISFTTPDWVPVIGGKTFGFNIGYINELAQGGVLEKGQMGLLEGSGAEAVVPLEKNTKWIRRVADEMQEAGPDSYTDAADEVIEAIRGMKLWLDGRTIAGGIAGPMDQSLGGRSIMAGRGVATA